MEIALLAQKCKGDGDLRKKVGVTGIEIAALCARDSDVNAGFFA